MTNESERLLSRFRNKASEKRNAEQNLISYLNDQVEQRVHSIYLRPYSTGSKLEVKIDSNHVTGETWETINDLFSEHEINRVYDGVDETKQLELRLSDLSGGGDDL